MEADLPNILMKLGFSKEKTAFLSSKITVDAARGSGHAWGADMKAEKAHLRTRVPADGMNYKGYVIAVHEFGHNVEQTISLHDVDYYMMKGVPNTAFTEALAYMFQARDLELLGLKETLPDKKHLLALETFWNAYEIMGVCLVDMRAWKWMYENPEAAPAQLKEAVIRIAVEVWNQYYAEIMGVKDQSILAIYSHMISYPLYLSAYSYGHMIDFQVEQYIRDKNFAGEVERMFSAGRLIPQLWMKKAVGEEISIQPLLKATDEALGVVSQ
jgi:oligoendopeptidase F